MVRTTFRIKTIKTLLAENKLLRTENEDYFNENNARRNENDQLFIENERLRAELEEYKKRAVISEEVTLSPCKSPQCYGCKFAATVDGKFGRRLYGCMKDCICADYEPVHTVD